MIARSLNRNAFEIKSGHGFRYLSPSHPNLSQTNLQGKPHPNPTAAPGGTKPNPDRWYPPCRSS